MAIAVLSGFDDVERPTPNDSTSQFSCSLMMKRKIPNLLCRVVRNWKCDYGHRGLKRL